LRSDRPAAERVVADIKAAGGNAFAAPANVSVVAEVVEQTTDEQLHKMLDTRVECIQVL